MALFTDENDEILVELIAKNPPLFDSRLTAYKDNIVRDNIWEHIIASKLNKTSDDCRKRWKCIRDSYQRIKRKNKLPTGSAACSKIKKWPLLERLSFLEKVPTERKTISNIEWANDDNGTESEVSHDVENDVNREKEGYVEPDDEIEMNSGGASEAAMVSASTSAKEINISETAAMERSKKNVKSSRCELKKKKESQNSSLQMALLQYWKERDAERRGQIQNLTQHQQQEPDVDGIQSFCSHVGTMLRKLTPALRIEAKSKVFNLLVDYELKSLNQSSSNSLSSIPSDQGSISSHISPVEATDLSISNSYNVSPNTFHDHSYYQLNDVNESFTYLP